MSAIMLVGIVPDECRGDEGGDDAPAALAGIGRALAHEAHTATLPVGIEHFCGWRP